MPDSYSLYSAIYRSETSSGWLGIAATPIAFPISMTRFTPSRPEERKMVDAVGCAATAECSSTTRMPTDGNGKRIASRNATGSRDLYGTDSRLRRSARHHYALSRTTFFSMSAFGDSFALDSVAAEMISERHGDIRAQWESGDALERITFAR